MHFAGHIENERALTGAVIPEPTECRFRRPEQLRTMEILFPVNRAARTREPEISQGPQSKTALLGHVEGGAG